MSDDSRLQLQGDLIKEPNGVFGRDLFGYAASAAAAELAEHWQNCATGNEPLDAAIKRSDVDNVILVLTEWRDTIL